MGTNESPTKKDTIARTSTVPTYTLETLTNNYFAIPPTDQHPLLYGLCLNPGSNHLYVALAQVQKHSVI